MAGYNRIIIVGNLTREPEYKQMSSGQGLCRLGLASNRQYKNKQTGSMVNEVCFVDVDVWGPQAESCRQYLQKGRSALVEGRLKFDTWEQDGQKRSKHIIIADRVVFLSGPSAEDSDADQTEDKVEPRNQVEQDIMNQVEEIKTRAATSSTPKRSKKQAVVDDFPQTSMGTGEVSFKDEPPFQDDLPF